MSLEKGRPKVSGNGETMSIIGHIAELRRRLVNSLIAVGAAFAVTYYYSDSIYEYLSRPLMSALPLTSKFVIFTNVSEPFMVYLKVAFAAALALASPVVLYNVWAFVAPALYDKEKKWFLPLVLLSSALFLVGVWFCYFIVMPVALKYLIGLGGAEVRPYIAMGDYLSLALQFVLAFGAAFQLPLIMMVLARTGAVTSRKYISYWRYAIVAAFVIGAILSPPDVFSQTLMSVPLILLYVLGIFLSYLFEK